MYEHKKYTDRDGNENLLLCTVLPLLIYCCFFLFITCALQKCFTLSILLLFVFCVLLSLWNKLPHWGQIKVLIDWLLSVVYIYFYIICILWTAKEEFHCTEKHVSLWQWQLIMTIKTLILESWIWIRLPVKELLNNRLNTQYHCLVWSEMYSVVSIMHQTVISCPRVNPLFSSQAHCSVIMDHTDFLATPDLTLIGCLCWLNYLRFNQTFSCRVALVIPAFSWFEL